MITLPGSKSIAARALVLDRVFNLRLRFENLPDCDDTCELLNALEAYDKHGGEPLRLNLGNGGTSLRFFLALAASTPGLEVLIDCGEQLRRRPIAPLIDALRSAGADIECLEREGFAPMRVKGRRLDGEGVVISCNLSSQFASALLMVSPLWVRPVKVDEDALVSRPYFEMTQKMLAEFGRMAQSRVHAPYVVEPDWSAASFFYEYAQLHPGRKVEFARLTFPGRSLQGDSNAAFLFGLLGVDTVYRPDGSAVIKGSAGIIGRMAGSDMPMRFAMHSTPDLVPPMVVCMCLSGIRFVMTGVASLRHKESDRLAVLAEELRKAGYVLDDGAGVAEAFLGDAPVAGDMLVWMGERCEVPAPPVFHSHGDHRMAMAFSVAADLIPGACVEGMDSVTKSFPDFPAQLRSL